jgi:hypothetical protein
MEGLVDTGLRDTRNASRRYFTTVFGYDSLFPGLMLMTKALILTELTQDSKLAAALRCRPSIRKDVCRQTESTNPS